MRLKLLILALLLSAVAAAAPIIQDKQAGKNPIDREWMIILTTREGLIVGIDPKSFKVIKPGEEFSFDSLMIFEKNSPINLPGLPPASAQVTTLKASCSKLQAQIIADTLHDDGGKVLATNLAAKKDVMGPIEPTSPAGRVITQVCAGKPLVPTKQKEKEDRTESSRKA